MDSVVPLGSLPVMIQHGLFKRMDNRTLCRMRQTCSYLNSFVEKHRFSLSNRRVGSQYILEIINDGYEPQCYIAPNTSPFGVPVSSRHDNFFCFFDEVLPPVKLTDPYAQMSGISLLSVDIGFDPFRFLRRDWMPDDHIVKLLRKLRPTVEWLGFNGKWNPEILKSVNFSRLEVVDNCPDISTLIDSGPENLKEVIWLRHHFKKVQDCVPLFSQLEVLQLHYMRRQNAEENSKFLVEVLECVRSNKVSRGILKRLRLFAIELPKAFALPGAILLYSFVDSFYNDTKICVYKVPANDVDIIII